MVNNEWGKVRKIHQIWKEEIDCSVVMYCNVQTMPGSEIDAHSNECTI